MKNKSTKWGIFFILPFFLMYFIFNFYPIVYTFKLSLTKYDGYSDPVWVGFQNYANLIFDEFFWEAFFNTWSIWLPNIIMQIAIAMLLAVLFTDVRIRLKGVKFFRAIFYFPNLVTAASVSLLALVLLDYQSGTLNQILFGDDKSKYIRWLSNPRGNQFIVSIIQTWQWFGNSMIILIAGLQAIPRDYYESAEVDGASAFARFIHITFPLILPIFIYISITSLIGGMQMFDIPYVMGTGPTLGGSGQAGEALITMIYYMYNKAFAYDQIGYGAAITYFLFALIVIFSAFYIRMITLGKKKEAK